MAIVSIYDVLVRGVVSELGCCRPVAKGEILILVVVREGGGLNNISTRGCGSNVMVFSLL